MDYEHRKMLRQAYIELRQSFFAEGVGEQYDHKVRALSHISFLDGYFNGYTPPARLDPLP